MARITLDLGGVLVVYGPESYLADRAVDVAIQSVRHKHAEVELTRLAGADLDIGRFAELTGPSLFADERMLVVTNLEQIPDEVQPAVLDHVSAPTPEIALVLAHGGGQRNRPFLDKLRKAAGGPKSPSTYEATALKTYQLPDFVSDEIAHAGGRIDAKTAAALVDAVGTDLRELAAACSQLVSDTSEESSVITTETVARYFAGRAEVSGFAVADAAMAGDPARTLEQVRWALATGVAPVLMTSALANALRGLARFISAPQGLREADLAREVGVPPWKLKTLRQQARNWTPRGLAIAITAVAQADADVKGASGDPGYALERMVLTVCRAGRG